MSASLDKLRKKRGSIRRSASVLTRQVEELCVEGNIDEAKKLQLRTLKVELLEKKGSLKELDEEILDYFNENDKSDEVIDKDMKESSEDAQKVTSAI